ncbi:hypothetical protein D3C71_1710270 [compost metagenome]
MHGQRPFGRVFATVEWKAVWAALALRVDVDTPHLIGEGIDQTTHLRGILAENTELLAEIGIEDVFDDCFQITVNHHRYNRPELFFVVHTHVGSHRVQHRRIEERLTDFSPAGVDDVGAFADSIGHKPGQKISLAWLWQGR